MKVNEFLESKIIEMVEAFEDIQCRYRFDAPSSTHYIEILPIKIFDESTDLQCFQADIYDEFDEKYPKESLVFISEDSLTKIGQATFTKAGDKYSHSLPSQLQWLNELNVISKGNKYGIPVSAGKNNYALAA